MRIICNVIIFIISKKMYNLGEEKIEYAVGNQEFFFG